MMLSKLVHLSGFANPYTKACWITNPTRRKMNNKLLIIICNLVLLSSCSQNDCCDVVSVLKLSDSLYDETYRTYCGGVYGGDVCRTYITDSISFRKYIGKYDDHEMIFCKISMDSSRVYVFFKKDIGIIEHRYDTTLLYTYDINLLKQEAVFDEPCKHK